MPDWIEFFTPGDSAAVALGKLYRDQAEAAKDGAVGALAQLTAPQTMRRVWRAPRDTSGPPSWAPLFASDIMEDQVASNAVARTLADRSRDFVNVRDFGVTMDGSTNDTVAFQRAIDRALADSFALYVPRGTALVDGLTIGTRQTIRGEGRHSTIQLRAGTRASVISNKDVSTGNSGIILRGLRVLGNKGTIVTPARSRGVYLQRGDDHYLEDVTVENVEDHGIFFSGAVNEDEEPFARSHVLIRCRAIGCGDDVVLTTGGTGILASGSLYGCWGFGNLRNGFKGSNVRYVSCTAQGSTQGGGFELGYGSTSNFNSSFMNCVAIDNAGDGFRCQGEGDFVSFTDCLAEGNGLSGWNLFGNTVRMTIHGCRSYNNGWQPGPRTTSGGRDGISVLKANTGRVQSVTISNMICTDRQATKTQEYGLYVEGDDQEVEVGPGCDFSGNLAGPYRLTGGLRAGGSNGNGAQIRVPHIIRGGNNYFALPALITHTGTTDQTTLWSMTQPSREPHIGSRWRLSLFGTTTGTGGTKQVRLAVGGTSQLILNSAAGANDPFVIDDIEFIFATSTAFRWAGRTSGGTPFVFTSGASYLSEATVFDVRVTATLGNPADSIVLQSLEWRQTL